MAGAAAGLAAGAGWAAGAGAAVPGAALAGWLCSVTMAESLLVGLLTANAQQMESTQITMARLHVAFSMKSVVLR